MSLLQRLYDPHEGTILIDGHDLKDYDIRFLRSRIVIVDQFTVLFNVTIFDNLTYGMNGVSHEEVVQACKDAKAWDFIQKKPDGLYTVIQDGGKNLSGGEKQRLAIARAMVRKPDVILLDEATSALDNKNEALVQAALDTFTQKGSALVIAHRLSTIMDSDKIIVIDEGEKVEEGSHEQLLHMHKDDELLKPPSGRKEAPKKASYKQLWEAATGKDHDKDMNLKQIKDKIQELTHELQDLHWREQSLQQEESKKHARIRWSKIKAVVHFMEGADVDEAEEEEEKEEETKELPEQLKLGEKLSSSSGCAMSSHGREG